MQKYKVYQVEVSISHIGMELSPEIIEKIKNTPTVSISHIGMEPGPVHPHCCPSGGFDVSISHIGMEQVLGAY